MPKRSDPIGRVNKLYNRGLLVLSREMERLVQLSIAEKLPASASKDLVAYIKLLGDMKEAQQAIAADKRSKEEQATKAKSDKELEEAIKGAL